MEIKPLGIIFNFAYKIPCPKYHFNAPASNELVSNARNGIQLVLISTNCKKDCNYTLIFSHNTSTMRNSRYANTTMLTEL